MRLIKLDEQAHLCDVQTPKGEYFISRCSGNRRKEDALTWGGLFVFFYEEKSAEIIVPEKGRIKCQLSLINKGGI